MSVSTISGLFEICMKGHVTGELARLVGDVLGTEAGTAFELCAKYGRAVSRGLMGEAFVNRD